MAHTAIQRLSETSGARAGLAATAGRILRRLKMLGATLTRRRAIYDLSRLDDRLLADMGLTRSDLQAASRFSLWGDPTDRLTEVAAERRAAGR